MLDTRTVAEVSEEARTAKCQLHMCAWLRRISVQTDWKLAPITHCIAMAWADILKVIRKKIRQGNLGMTRKLHPSPGCSKPE